MMLLLAALAAVQIQTAPRIQRLSWAGVRIEGPQSTLFVDPVSSKEIWDGKREVVPIEATSKRRAVLITHLHNDHFDAKAIKTLLADGGQLFCVDTMAAVAASKGIVTRPVPMYQPETFGDFVFIPVPAADGFGDAQVSWIIKSGAWTIIHCGDTIWHSGFDRLGRAYGPFDIALLPVNGVVVRGRPVDVDVPATMTPAQAVAAAQLLRAKVLVPIHYGASDDDYREVPDAAHEAEKAGAAKGVPVHVVREGDWIN